VGLRLVVRAQARRPAPPAREDARHRGADRDRQRLEKTRATAAQTATANRNQISQLQRELAERTTLSKTQRAARDEEAAAAAARKRALLEDDSFDKTIRLPAHGFADTQPMV